ncbi:MAG: hypothetical protein HPZ91_11835 [Lentisphaeria bacterium]|nr:hypothetical protein [Lentisphaeria bacterium]
MKWPLFIVALAAVLCFGCGDYRSHETESYRKSRLELFKIFKETENLTDTLLSCWGVGAEKHPHNTKAIRSFFKGFCQANEIVLEAIKNYHESCDIIGCPKNCPHRDILTIDFDIVTARVNARYLSYQAALLEELHEAASKFKAISPKEYKANTEIVKSGTITGEDRKMLESYKNAITEGINTIKKKFDL